MGRHSARYTGGVNIVAELQASVIARLQRILLRDSKHNIGVATRHNRYPFRYGGDLYRLH